MGYKLYYLQSASMKIFKYSNNVLLFSSFLLLVYITFLLIFNISSGFDITDESFYILSAQYQNEIFPVVRRDGYYTGILYILSGHNLAYHRLLGILILMGVTAWFSIELYKYIVKKLDGEIIVRDKWLFIVPLMTGSLVYYKSWLITPSYNWLALVSIILVFISLFRIVTNSEKNYDRYITLDYLILSFSLNLAFMSKPTTALLLTMISLIFVIFEFKYINLQKAFPSILVLTIMIVLGHIIFLEEGVDLYYHRLIESLERMKVFDSRYTLDNRIINTYELTKQFFFEGFYFHKINKIYIFSLILIIIMLYIIHFKKNVLYIYTVLIYIILIIYSYFLFKYGIANNFRLLWVRAIELLFLSLIFVSTSILFIDQKKVYLVQNINTIKLILLLLLGSFAYSFGTNTYIFHSMSASFILMIAAILTISYFFDKIHDLKIFTSTMGLILSLNVCFSIQDAYKHPYRLITDIEGQNKNVAFLGGLEVDETTKQYIESLQKISSQNKEKNEKISLIDMTGGSPGANVILNADFFGEPWIAGAYKGSNKFAEKVLKSYKGTAKLKKAWILVSPKGRRKLDLNILNKIGLNFPNNYKKIGTVKTAHRNELQELWKPTSILK